MGSAILARVRLQAAAELAAAAGGRVIAEEIARRAEDNVFIWQLFPPPETAEWRRHPEHYLTAADREELQSAPWRSQVEAAALEYLQKNAGRSLAEATIAVPYPYQRLPGSGEESSAPNACDGTKNSALGTRATVEIAVQAQLPFPLFLTGATRLLHRAALNLAATGVYLVPFCP